MSARLQITLRGADGVAKKMDLARSLVAGPGLRKTLDAVGMLAVRSIQRGIREQRSPDGKAYKPVNRYGRPGKRLQDTKRLLNSITHQVSGGSRVTVGTNVIYAALQHHGGTVKPKKGKKLAIPLARQVARAVMGRGFRAAFPDAFTFTSKRGLLLLVRKSEPSGKLQLLALLVDSSTVEGTRFLGLSKSGQADILSYLQSAIARSVSGGR